ncbi:arylamine N-acetyltransferase [Streptosporangium sp. NBC_01639]|uniref:arylamine N-acetyltransferase n=1 Tax=Streptosporangium sp. NBC_01639 TaxID=2975948 RepID=UPI00386399D2
MPFENIDVRLRKPRGIGAAAVQKIVHRRPGGACYPILSLTTPVSSLDHTSSSWCSQV